MRLDDDAIALALVAFITVAFVFAAVYQGEIITLAQASIQFGMGAIAGYMRRGSKSDFDEEKLKKLIQRNKALEAEIKSLKPTTQRRSPHYSGDENL